MQLTLHLPISTGAYFIYTSTESSSKSSLLNSSLTLLLIPAWDWLLLWSLRRWAPSPHSTHRQGRGQGKVRGAPSGWRPSRRVLLPRGPEDSKVTWDELLQDSLLISMIFVRMYNRIVGGGGHSWWSEAQPWRTVQVPTSLPFLSSVTKSKLLKQSKPHFSVCVNENYQSTNFRAWSSEELT